MIGQNAESREWITVIVRVQSCDWSEYENCDLLLITWYSMSLPGGGGLFSNLVVGGKPLE